MCDTCAVADLTLRPPFYAPLLGSFPVVLAAIQGDATEVSVPEHSLQYKGWAVLGRTSVS